MLSIVQALGAAAEFAPAGRAPAAGAAELTSKASEPPTPTIVRPAKCMPLFLEKTRKP
jgi:hypothetical protein